MAEGKWRDLPPVKRAVSIENPDYPGELRVSQTLLKVHDRCDRAAYLHVLHEGGVGSHEMNRGSIFHRFVAKAIAHLIAENEHQLAPETAKDLLLEVYDESPELGVNAKERDSLRAMVWNWCGGTYFHPEQIIGVEKAITLEVGDWIVRLRPDLVERPHYGRVDVTDWKTSFAMPTADEWEGDFQTTLYALGVVFGIVDDLGMPLAPEAEEIGLRLKFPRWSREDGLAEKFALVTKEQLLDFRLDLEHQLRRLEENLESGKWPATPGAHCGECPSPEECPLPRHLRPDSQLTVAGLADAEKLAEWWYTQGMKVQRAKRRIKKWASENGVDRVRIGSDLELRFEHRQEYPDLDREELFLEVEGAVEYGHELDVEKYRQKKDSVRFEKRTVRPEEKAA